MRAAGFITITFILMFSIMLQAAVKPDYGGNLKVADELLSSLQAQNLFSMVDGTPHPLFPFPYTLEGSVVTIDLASVNPDVFTEIEKSLAALQNPDHACHWILDYPYLGHHHTTSVEAQDGKIRIQAESPEVLAAILDSACLMPQPVAALQPFVKTQFGFEANPACLAGRPFLNSITPAPVDPLNPYLSFKLKDADVITVPEDHYQQVSRDQDVQLLPGPRYFVFLKTEGLKPETAAAVASAIHIADLSNAVLNGHAEPLLNSTSALAPRPGARVRVVYPDEPPYRLIGERIVVELHDAGFEVSSTATSVLQLMVLPLRTANDDIMRYLALRNFVEPAPGEGALARPWYELWDQEEASGRILPLLLHTSTLAVRQGIHNFHTGPAGVPDFSNVWLESKP
ncbi:MAG TPA: hypothetical protein VLR94_08905 [Acidobacteriota bacterium]|nr:hypothetical protein [Acidobacteriota bacterium]